MDLFFHLSIIVSKGEIKLTITQLINQVKNYRHILNRQSKTIGSVIKHHRGETRLTLEEISEGICSVSYLCKVENNQIVPSKTILPKIISRLNIKEDELKETYNSDWILTVLAKDYVSEELIKNAKNKNNYQAKLINYGRLILNEHDYVGAYKQFLDLTRYLPHFKEEEMCFFLYLYIIMCDKKERYTDSLVIAREVLKFTKNELVIMKVKLKEFKAINKLAMISQIDLYYNNLIQTIIEYDQFSLINYARRYHLSYLAKSLTTRELDEEINKLNNMPDESISYIYFSHHYYKRQDYLSAFHQINKIKHINDHYFVMTLICLYKLKKVDKIDELIANFKLPIRNSYQDVISYITCDDNQKVDFIKGKLLATIVSSEEKAISDFLYIESYELLKSKYLYKDSSSILEKHNMILNRSLGINLSK